MKTQTSGATRTQYLSFAIASEEYAVEILRVREIIEYDTLTRVPAMPPAVRGVINLRGRVVPVVDLAARFGLAPLPVTRRSCIVLVEVAVDDGPMVVGIITDAVSQVLELAPDELEPPPAFGTTVGAEFLDGMSESGKKFVMVLNVDRALAAAALQPQGGLVEPAHVADAQHEPDAAPANSGPEIA
jgi:purine-binding chemotaxis protein CheW